MHEQKIAGTRRHLKSERLQCFCQPGQPDVIVLGGFVDEVPVHHRRSSGSDCRSADIERPANPVQHLRHMERAIGPAEPQGRQAVNLRESTGHHHIVESGDKLDSRFIIVAPDIFGIGRVEYQQHVLR